jgi:hypothetical protein
LDTSSRPEATTTDTSSAFQDNPNVFEEADAESKGDLVGKLYRLVQKGTQQDKALSQELLQRQKETEEQIQLLEAQREKTHKDQLMLQRLQACLDEGVDESRLKQQHLQIKEEQLGFQKEKKALEMANARVKELEARLLQRESSLNELQAKLKQHELELSSKEKSHLNQTNLIAIKEKEINKKENDLLKQAAALETLSARNPPELSFSPRRKNSECDSGPLSCNACLQIVGCAWCRNPAKCLAHNVNAQEHADEDGLVSGLCQPEQWSSAIGDKLTLLSLDVFGADNNHEKARLVNILALLNKADADIVTFQEATSWLLEGLLADSWTKKTYHLTEFGKSHHVPGGLLILSKTSLYGVSYYEQVHPGQTQNDERGKLLLIQTKVNESPITVATTTLDWRSAATRAGSLDFIFSVLSPFADVFLTGGFNFDAGAQPESAHVPMEYVDVWPNVYSSNVSQTPGFTWNPSTNEYAYQSDKHSQPSRIDKIFLRSSEWMARTVSLVGCSASDLLCQKSLSASSSSSSSSFKTKLLHDLQSSYVSNHYGLLLELARFQPHCV